jgi:cytochrome c biogenesis protein
VWRFFAAPATLLILLALLAAALVLSTLIPQIPPDVSTNPQLWLALQPELQSPSNDLAQAVGLYGIYDAFWFRLLLVLTGLALFVWMVESAELAWRASRGRWTPSTLALWGSHPLRHRLAVPRAPAQIEGQLGGSLAGRGYRTAPVARSHGIETAPNWVASRHGALLWARPLAYAGLLLALLGLAMMAIWGWQSSQWQPAVGERLAVGHGTGYTIRLDAFDPLTGAEVQPEGGQYESRITWLAGDQPVGQDLAGIGRPATRGGLAVRQVGYVPDVTLRGVDQAGKPVLFQPGGVTSKATEQVSLAFGSSETQQVIVLPGQGFFLLLDLEPASGGADPLLRLALLRSAEAEQESLAVLRQSGAVSFDGLNLEVDLGYRPVLQVDYRPGMLLVIAGIALAAVAVAVGWLAGPRLVWMAVAPDQAQAMVHLLALGGAGESGWLSRLAAQLQQELTDVA